MGLCGLDIGWLFSNQLLCKIMEVKCSVAMILMFISVSLSMILLNLYVV
jgi:hypothetical protein